MKRNMYKLLFLMKGHEKEEKSIINNIQNAVSVYTN